MQLNKLLLNTGLLEIVGSEDVDVSGLAYDSRQVEPGDVYFALPGVHADGHDFIPQAVERGAVALVGRLCPQDLPSSVSFVRVDNVRLTMAQAAALFFGEPTQGIPVIGVTGTNGKTTITYLLEAVLKEAGYSPAVFGTVEYRCDGQRTPASHTTPESVELLKIMAAFRGRGADAMILEASSHALEQHRVDGIEFDLAIFTNLTRDHLDYHSSFESYFASKKRLFTDLLGDGPAVINSDDPYGEQLLEINTEWTSYGQSGSADIHPLSVTVGRDGIHGIFRCGAHELTVDSGMIGDFNVSNLMAAMAAAQRLGVETDRIARGLSQAPQVPGRLERVENDKGVLALVDFAHTGDALEQVLKTLSGLESRRLIAIAGCGGDRDPGKRPIMACVTTHYADLAIFTSDNPRTEDPVEILGQMRQGALEKGYEELTQDDDIESKDGFIVINDRREAINFAVRIAKSGDLLLVAGKGHEDYQILGVEKIHFDDREELRRALSLKVGEQPIPAGKN